MSKFKNILTDLGINEKFNKRISRPVKFNHVKDNVPLVEDWNMMADLLFCPPPSLDSSIYFV